MKLLRNISLPLIASLAFFACERDYDAPLLTEPEYTGPAANITINELRTENAAATEDAPIIITQDQVLKAVITGNDESGNIYKKIYLQDETGAIEMEVDQGSVYNYYPVGQVVYIDLNGLSISVYGDEQQLGHPGGYLYRTPWEDFEKHVSKDGWANPENAKPLVIDDISKINTDPEAYKFKLIQFTGVTFQNGGTGIFAPEDGYGEENITDSQGNSLMVRTSNYASFAGEKLPKGKGNVTGILGRFRGTWQLTLRTAADVSDFVEGGDEGGETPGGETETVILDESFASGLGAFTIDDKVIPSELTYVWNYDDRNGGYMKASAHISQPSPIDYATESWLVSPEINLSTATKVSLKFDHTINFAKDMQAEQTLWVTEVDIENWKRVNITTYPVGDSWNFVSSGDIDLSAYAGKKIKFGFKYVSTTGGAATWEIKNLKVTATTGGSNDGSSDIAPIPTNI